MTQEHTTNNEIDGSQGMNPKLRRLLEHAARGLTERLPASNLPATVVATRFELIPDPIPRSYVLWVWLTTRSPRLRNHSDKWHSGYNAAVDILTSLREAFGGYNVNTQHRVIMDPAPSPGGQHHYVFSVHIRPTADTPEHVLAMLP